MVHKEKGLVLRVYDSADQSKNIVVLFKTYGKLTLCAKGSKKINSKLLAGTQLFSYSEFCFFESANTAKFCAVNSADLITSFDGLQTDYDVFELACRLLKYIDRYTMQEQECDDILLLAITTLQKLAKKALPNEVVYFTFMLKFSQALGYFEPLDIPLPDPVQKSIEYIMDADIKTIFNYKIDDEYIYDLKKCGDILIARLEDL